jgi:hypothetical protein
MDNLLDSGSHLQMPKHLLLSSNHIPDASPLPSSLHVSHMTESQPSNNSAAHSSGTYFAAYFDSNTVTHANLMPKGTYQWLLRINPCPDAGIDFCLCCICRS